MLMFALLITIIIHHDHLVPPKLSAGLPDPRSPAETSAAVDIFELHTRFENVLIASSPPER